MSKQKLIAWIGGGFLGLFFCVFLAVLSALTVHSSNERERIRGLEEIDRWYENMERQIELDHGIEPDE